MSRLYGRTPKIAPARDDGQALARDKGIPAGRSQPAGQPVRTEAMSSLPQGAPMVKATLPSFPKYVAQRPGDVTIRTAMSNIVSEGISIDWNALWKPLMRDHKLLPEQVKPYADALECCLMCDDVQTAVERADAILRRMQRAYGLPETSMVTLGKSMRAFGDKTRLLARRKTKADALYRDSAGR